MTCRRSTARVLAAAATLVFVFGCRDGRRESPAATAAGESPVAVTEKWRAKHETDYRRDWVTIAGLYPLKPGVNTAGSAGTNTIVLPPSVPPRLGRFVRKVTVVAFEPATGVTVSLNGQPVTPPVQLRDDRVPKADELVVGNVRLVVPVSGETGSLRVRDPNGALAKGFLGFTGSRSICTTGWSAGSSPIQPQQIKVLKHVRRGRRVQERRVVEFTLLGQALRSPVHHAAQAFLLRLQRCLERAGNLRGGAVSLRRSADDGSVVLFQSAATRRAFNPPPPARSVRENRLAIKILAGEKAIRSPAARERCESRPR